MRINANISKKSVDARFLSKLNQVHAKTLEPCKQSVNTVEWKLGEDGTAYAGTTLIAS
jgi:hypothetical protein